MSEQNNQSRSRSRSRSQSKERKINIQKQDSKNSFQQQSQELNNNEPFDPQQNNDHQQYDIQDQQQYHHEQQSEQFHSQQDEFQNNYQGNSSKNYEQYGNEEDGQGKFSVPNLLEPIDTNISSKLDSEQLPNGMMVQQQQSFRHARRLYVGNIPEMITQDYITEWLYRSMEACGGLLESGNPIIKVQIDSKSKFAFIEMRSIEETTALLQLDGIILWNRALRIRRPTEYEKYPKVFGNRPIPQLDLSLLEGIGILIIPTQVNDSPNKIFLANLPNTLDEYTILENLKLREHGELKAFHLVKDNQTNESKGFAFFEYKDPSITDHVINALNGCQFYQRTLTCKRAIGDQGESGQGKRINRHNNNRNNHPRNNNGNHNQDRKNNNFQKGKGNYNKNYNNSGNNGNNINNNSNNNKEHTHHEKKQEMEY